MSQIGHEMGHRWSAFVSAKVNGETIQLGPTHWAKGLQAPVAFPYQRPVEASAMGGGVWQDNYDGTFTQLDDDYYVPATGWSYLDLYLMGFISAAEVPDFFILSNLVPAGRDANGHPIYKADRTKITIQDVIAAEGPRLPGVDKSQKNFNTGMVIVVEHGKTPSPELIERTNGIRERWIDYWTTTTGHRSAIRCTPCRDDLNATRDPVNSAFVYPNGAPSSVTEMWTPQHFSVRLRIVHALGTFRCPNQIFSSRLKLIFHCFDEMPQSSNVDINTIPTDTGRYGRVAAILSGL
jgi:hypothetical protein